MKEEVIAKNVTIRKIMRENQKYPFPKRGSLGRIFMSENVMIQQKKMEKKRETSQNIKKIEDDD